jgi:hypothetical protein
MILNSLMNRVLMLSCGKGGKRDAGGGQESLLGIAEDVRTDSVGISLSSIQISLDVQSHGITVSGSSNEIIYGFSSKTSIR